MSQSNIDLGARKTYLYEHANSWYLKTERSFEQLLMFLCEVTCYLFCKTSCKTISLCICPPLAKIH